jgi:valyl-tRNA synthetase
MRIAPQGQDIRFDEQQIVEGRNFFNKLERVPVPEPQGKSIRRIPFLHPLSIFARPLAVYATM